MKVYKVHTDHNVSGPWVLDSYMSDFDVSGRVVS
jgi:hypothetical protein